MDAPTRGSATTSTQIQIQWNALTTAYEIGDAPIKSYNLQWDVDGTDTNYVDLVGSTTPYIQTSYAMTGLTPG